jgi:proline iminopeptidase
MTSDLRRVYPEAWDRFVSAVPESMRDQPLADVYATLVFDPDPEVRDRAALEWCRWDNAQMGRPKLPARFDDPDYRLRYARLVTHYWRNGSFLEEDQLLRDAPKLNGIPGVLIHGGNDLSCPLDTGWHLSKAWTTSELVVVDSGHGSGTEFSPAVVAALDRFR